MTSLSESCHTLVARSGARRIVLSVPFRSTRHHALAILHAAAIALTACTSGGSEPAGPAAPDTDCTSPAACEDAADTDTLVEDAEADPSDTDGTESDGSGDDSDSLDSDDADTDPCLREFRVSDDEDRAALITLECETVGGLWIEEHHPEARPALQRIRRVTGQLMLWYAAPNALDDLMNIERVGELEIWFQYGYTSFPLPIRVIDDGIFYDTIYDMRSWGALYESLESFDGEFEAGGTIFIPYCENERFVEHLRTIGLEGYVSVRGCGMSNCAIGCEVADADCDGEPEPVDAPCEEGYECGYGFTEEGLRGPRCWLEGVDRCDNCGW